MVIEGKRTRTAEPLLNRVAPFIQLIALFGIPAVGWFSLVLLLQIPRAIYGQSIPLLFAAEIGSLVTVLFLVLALRACLKLSLAPRGHYRNILDFLAISRWHPSVIAALIGLLVLPAAWHLRGGNWWLVTMLARRGRAALASVDVQAGMDGTAVAYQLALTGGVPLLFALHMLSRWKPKYRLLPWVLVPVLFVGTAIAVVVLVTLLHTPS